MFFLQLRIPQSNLFKKKKKIQIGKLNDGNKIKSHDNFAEKTQNITERRGIYRRALRLQKRKERLIDQRVTRHYGKESTEPVTEEEEPPVFLLRTALLLCVCVCAIYRRSSHTNI